MVNWNDFKNDQVCEDIYWKVYYLTSKGLIFQVIIFFIHAYSPWIAP